MSTSKNHESNTSKNHESNTTNEERPTRRRLESNNKKDESESIITNNNERATRRTRQSTNKKDESESNITSNEERTTRTRRQSNNRKDEKAVDTKPREALKRKKSPSVEETNLTKSRGRQRYPPPGPGGVVWVYPGTNKAVKKGDKAHFKIKGKAGWELRVGEILLRLVINNVPQVKVCWFYKPEQTPEGRQKYHSEAELMATYHHAVFKLDSLVEKVDVYDSVDAYDQGVRSRGPNEYFYRFFYNHVTREIVAMDGNTMELHCVCRCIYNPDLLMIQCNECGIWYHTSCLSLSVSRSKAQKMPSYICPSCRSSSASTVNKV